MRIYIASLLFVFSFSCQPRDEGASRNGPPVSGDQYFADLHSKATVGDPEAQFNLAGLYGLGQGIP